MAAVDAAEVVVATSAQEAVEAFGSGADVTVVAGGTIVVPEITHGRLRPRRALLLGGAGLAGLAREAGRTTIGAMTTVAALEQAPEPLRGTARHVADAEIRAQATLGGNLCAPPGEQSPRGDLQAALIALGAQVRSAGADGERTEDVEEFLAASPGGRLVLDVSFADPEAGSTAAVRRPHAHAYTVLAVCAARTGGQVRIAASGAGPRAVRCRAAEAAFADAGDAQAAADRVLDDVTPHDDALASAWYRSRTLPVLVRRALTDLT
jgi:aerobic carbon-monoxide dehydrogenase medium subunit